MFLFEQFNVFKEDPEADLAAEAERAQAQGTLATETQRGRREGAGLVLSVEGV